MHYTQDRNKYIFLNDQISCQAPEENGLNFSPTHRA